MQNKDQFEIEGLKFEVPAKWLKNLCKRMAIEDAEDISLRHGSKESYIEGRTDNLYENIEAETVYEYAVKDGLIEDTLNLDEVELSKGVIILQGIGDKKGTWVLVSTNAYSYDNMEQHVQVAFTQEEGTELFFKEVNWYLKDEKSTLGEYFEEGLTLQEYIELAKGNGEELQYGIEDYGSDKLFTILRKKLNNDENTRYDIEEVKVRLTFVPMGEKMSIIGEPLLDNVEDLEALFNKVKA